MGRIQTGKLHIGVGVLKRLKEELNANRSEKVLLIVESENRGSSFFYKLMADILKDGIEAHFYFVPRNQERLHQPYQYPSDLYGVSYDTIIALGSFELLNYASFLALFSESIGQPRQKKSLILVPNTPTLGLEVAGLVYVYHQQVRTYPFMKRCYPTAVFYDPLMTTRIPLMQLLSSSILTLAEAIEYHYNSLVHRKLTTSAIHLVLHYLVRATYQRKDLEAKEALLRAGMFLGLSRQEDDGVSLLSCMVRPIYQKVNISYASVTAVLLPYMVKFYRLLEKGGKEIALLSELNYDVSFIELSSSPLPYRLAKLLRGVGFPLDLKSIGILERDLEALATHAYTLWSKGVGIEEEIDEEYFYAFYKSAYLGNIESFLD